jgi:hypothetical protein
LTVLIYVYQCLNRYLKISIVSGAARPAQGAVDGSLILYSLLGVIAPVSISASSI